MTPWRKAWLRHFPLMHHDREEHEREIAEARAAAAGARRQLGVAENLGDELEDIAHTLRAAGDRNHFSELLEYMLEHPQWHGERRR
jgi:NAD-dependent DNA ligase